jgi:hypothetical protein
MPADNRALESSRQVRRSSGKLPRFLTVKDLAHEFGCEPLQIRNILRARYKQHPLYAGWQWHTLQEANEVRKLLRTVFSDGRTR